VIFYFFVGDEESRKTDVSCLIMPVSETRILLEISGMIIKAMTCYMQRMFSYRRHTAELCSKQHHLFAERESQQRQ